MVQSNDTIACVEAPASKLLCFLDHDFLSLFSVFVFHLFHNRFFHSKLSHRCFVDENFHSTYLWLSSFSPPPTIFTSSFTSEQKAQSKIETRNISQMIAFHAFYDDVRCSHNHPRLITNTVTSFNNLTIIFSSTSSFISLVLVFCSGKKQLHSSHDDAHRFHLSLSKL